MIQKKEFYSISRLLNGEGFNKNILAVHTKVAEMLQITKQPTTAQGGQRRWETTEVRQFDNNDVAVLADNQYLSFSTTFYDDHMCTCWKVIYLEKVFIY